MTTSITAKLSTALTALSALVALLLTLSAHAADMHDDRAATDAHGAECGTYFRPFATDSFWNSRPLAPVFGDFVIPASYYDPKVTSGNWSTGVFLASDKDGPVTVYGKPGSKGVWDADAEDFREITIARWPADVVPDAKDDGHAEIVDPASGIIHSFYRLRKEDGKWIATQYAWTRLDGRGWGDPAHYIQGARAAAVSTTAGLIRKHEVADGRPLYRHALAMSLAENGLSADPAFVFPATSADRTASTNTGAIPEGALLMLPRSFDTEQLAHPDIRKIAETLKVYGAYVVDRNHGTPFVIYAENGADAVRKNLASGSAITSDLNKIRQALRQVIDVAGWRDARGKPYRPATNLNLLSMRGPWEQQEGDVPGRFDTWLQAVVFPETTTRSVMINHTSRGLHRIAWAMPDEGRPYRLTAITTGGGVLRLQILSKPDGRILYDSGRLRDGERVKFRWPERDAWIRVYAISGRGKGSTVRGELLRAR